MTLSYLRQSTPHRGCTLSWFVEGDGPPVVMIHGVGIGAAGWRPQVEGLASHFRCLCLDNRGFGASQPVGGALTVEVMADDVLPQAGAEEASTGLEAAARKERMKERTPRVDWAELLRRTFDLDVFACVRCGGRRSVVAYVKGACGVRAILEHLGLPTACASLAPARGPPQAAWC